MDTMSQCRGKRKVKRTKRPSSEHTRHRNRVKVRISDEAARALKDMAIKNACLFVSSLILKAQLELRPASPAVGDVQQHVEA